MLTSTFRKGMIEPHSESLFLAEESPVLRFFRYPYPYGGVLVTLFFGMSGCLRDQPSEHEGSCHEFVSYGAFEVFISSVDPGSVSG